MTSIEKTTIPISKVAIVVVFVGGLIAQYYTTLNAVKEGISDVKEEIADVKSATKLETQDLRNEDKLIRAELSAARMEAKEMKDAIVSYIGTGLKPEEPNVKRRR